MTTSKKEKILSEAIRYGCDVDGDVFVYKGAFYYVEPINNELERINELKVKLSFWKRRKITGRLNSSNGSDGVSKFEDIWDAMRFAKKS
jgi:hypothetical protein